MIITCPQCRKRYSVDDARLGEGPRKVRCHGCGKIFVSQTATTEEAAPRPASPPAVSPAPSPATPPVSKGSPLVLVAHDDAAFRGRIQKALQSFGCKVEAVRDGEQAFRYAVTHHPSLMVLQPRLAKLSGLAVCEGVKGSPDLKATRVALVGQAGWQQTIDRRAAALAYADDRFDANAPAAELTRRLGKLLGR